MKKGKRYARVAKVNLINVQAAGARYYWDWEKWFPDTGKTAGRFIGNY
jgi:hypothetical protein